MTNLEVYKQAIDDVELILSTLHGYNQKGHLYDKSIKEALIELKDRANSRFNKEECIEPKTLKEFKDQFEKLFLEMKEQVGVVSIEIKECADYNRSGWSPLLKEKYVTFNINIENG